MAAHEIIAVLLVAVPAVLLLALVVIERPRQLHRELHSVPLRPTGQLQEGMYRVTGRARRGQPLLVAPVSGRPCLAWRLVVERALGRSCRRRATACAAAAWPSTCAPAASSGSRTKRAGGGAAGNPLRPGGGGRATGGARPLVPAAAAGAGRDPAPARAPDAVTAVWDPHPGATARFTELTSTENEIPEYRRRGTTREPHPLGEARSARRGSPMRWTFRGTPAERTRLASSATLSSGSSGRS